MSDPLIYPVADGFVPYNSPVRIDGLRARACLIDEANGEAVDPSFRGDTIGYEDGQTMRVRPARGLDVA